LGKNTGTGRPSATQTGKLENKQPGWLTFINGDRGTKESPPGGVFHKHDKMMQGANYGYWVLERGTTKDHPYQNNGAEIA